MCVHFEIGLACDLRPDAPSQVLDTLRYMTRASEYEFEDAPTHPAFEGDLWRGMLQVGMPFFAVAPDEVARFVPFFPNFPGESGGVLRETYRYSPTGGEGFRHTLSFRTEDTDDQFGRYRQFLDWLAGYSETVGWVGYYRCQPRLHPTLLYFQDGKLARLEVANQLSGSVEVAQKAREEFL